MLNSAGSTASSGSPCPKYRRHRVAATVAVSARLVEIERAENVRSNVRAWEASRTASASALTLMFAPPCASNVRPNVRRTGPNVQTCGYRGAHVCTFDPPATRHSPPPPTPLGEHDVFRPVAGLLKNTVEGEAVDAQCNGGLRLG